MKDIHILGGVRTPFCAWARGRKGDGSPGGALKDVNVFDLGAVPLKEALRRSGTEPGELDAVVFGSAYHTHPNNCYGSRYIALGAGVPDRVPCLAVNMACATALQAVVTAGQMIRSGEARLVAAGGSESTSQIPKTVLFPSFKDLSAGDYIGRTVEGAAQELKIGRHEADAWALRSHARALLAREKGLLAEEIVPAGGADRDDYVLEEPSLERFESAKRTFEDGPGIVTGANAHGLVDGGGALVLSDKPRGKSLGTLASWAVAAVEPRRMAYATVPAIQEAVRRAGWKVGDVDLFEVNETFAAQLLVVQRTLDLPSERLNVNGGAVALGHPFGATGSRLVLTLLLQLRRSGLKRGVAAVCIGGGQGVALALEAA